MPHVLAIGEALIDALSVAFVDTLKDAATFRIQAGGSPANLCSYLTQLNTHATLVAAVGKDGFGEYMLHCLREKGVTTSHVQQLEGRATSLIMVGRSIGTPDFLPYRDADRYLSEVDNRLIEQASLVHTTAFGLSRNPARGVILRAMENAATAGKAISVDWNYSGLIWRKRKKAMKVFEKLCKLKPLLKFSMDDAERFWEQPLSVQQAKALLEKLPSTAVCLTCGKDGVWYKSDETDWAHHPAMPVVVKDATGAGDSFWAGFIAAFLDGRHLDTCVERGMETAAKKLQGLPLI